MTTHADSLSGECIRETHSDWLRLVLPLPVGLADLDPCFKRERKSRMQDSDRRHPVTRDVKHCIIQHALHHDITIHADVRTIT